ncbi:hypothetical protein HD553DRAFT_335268 [Filobasidium floriforme]|uniref:uncharacterized protein n=1 Tax=Filobasidium floriforme TaxID=5210 RepID=UPI001E8CDB53|nr:uncharacterized protein HD553DRAFT_335268 [Filobasidium floriforme]KAH8085383.1 hypothetical protein HD553DRAFT_335268 [Filobasidium floriforme]
MIHLKPGYHTALLLPAHVMNVTPWWQWQVNRLMESLSTILSRCVVRPGRQSVIRHRSSWSRPVRLIQPGLLLLIFQALPQPPGPRVLSPWSLAAHPSSASTPIPSDAWDAIDLAQEFRIVVLPRNLPTLVIDHVNWVGQRDLDHGRAGTKDLGCSIETGLLPKEKELPELLCSCQDKMKDNTATTDTAFDDLLYDNRSEHRCRDASRIHHGIYRDDVGGCEMTGSGRNR